MNDNVLYHALSLYPETGRVIDVNPAHAVRGPKYVVKKGWPPSS
jgi:hypothetical protein